MNRRISTNIFAATLTLLFAVTAFSQAQQEKSVTVFGAKINYIEAGDPGKPKIILLHGLGGSSANWMTNTAALAQNYHVIVLDQLGFGKSDKPSLKYRVATFADFLDKFMSELKIDKASLVGNSMGGWVAGLMAIKYSSRVEKIVLADAAGVVPANYSEADLYQLNNSTRDEIRANMKRIFANPLFQNNEALVDQFMTARVTANDGGTINSVIESIKRKEDFLNDRLGEIKKPTLIIWGKQDGLLPVADAYTFNKGIAGSELVIFDGCGHLPQFEKAAEFNKAVLAFIAK
ncbi:MAG: alpha/beta hydrolase [Pyrinomonadaceae bacterium]|nr:alpha/beta hydrolase [Pyrinomonadaceae bacterium]MBP6213508.1 alpha/beta hydrolase [Pyrinomonadaceae bacterium]